MKEGRHRTKYGVEKCVWGDRYFVEVFEEHFNNPGFAPEKYWVKICEIWMKYSDWERRIEFEDVTLVNLRTLKKICEIFKGRFEAKKYKRVSPTP